MKSLGRVAALSVGILAPACQSPSVENLLRVGVVEVTPPTAHLAIGSTVRLSATPKTSSGIVLAERPVVWSSSNIEVATVTPNGTVQALRPGPVEIRATADGVAGVAALTITPLPITRVTVAPSQVTVVIGETTLLTATAYDAANTVVIGQPVAWSSSAPATADVTTSGIVLGISEGGPVTITATVAGVTSAALVTVAKDAAKRLAFPQQVLPALVGQILNPPVLVAIHDSLGRTVTSSTAPVTIRLGNNPSGATLGGTLTVHAVSGIASFGDLVLDRAGNGFTLTATSPGLQPATSGTFDIGPPPLAIVTQPPAGAASGVSFSPQPVIRVRNGAGTPISGVAVTATIVSGGGTLSGITTVSSDASGMATYSNLSITGTSGSRTLRFDAPGYISINSTPVVVSAGTPTQLTITQQPSPGAQSGQPLAQLPILLLRDGANNPVPNTLVTASLTGNPAGASLVGGTTAVTNAAGVASFPGTGLGILGPVGNYSLTFTAGPATSAPSTAIALTAGTPTQLAYTQQPSGLATSGQPLAQAPILVLRDAANNPVGGQLVTATVTGSPAGVAPIGTTTATTNGSGVASFVGTGIGLSGPAGTYTLTFTSGGVSSPASSPITLSAGSGTQLTYNQQPSSSGNSGQAFAQQPILLLRDASNNPVNGVVVTATVTGAPAGVTFVGTTSVTTNPSGVATFVGSGLGLSGPVGNYTLTFRAGAVSSTASGVIALGPGTPTQLTYSQQPSAAANSGAPFTQQPILVVRDATNNLVPNATVTATITGSPAAASLVGTQTAVTNGSGVASFAGSGLGINGPVGNYTLTFRIGAASSAASNAITLSAGSPTQLTYTQQPSAAATSGQPFGQAPILLVRDGGNNPVSGQVVTATITGTPAGVSLIGTATATSNASGIATFVGSGLGLSGTVGSYSLTFKAGALTSAASSSITLGPGAATQLTITVQPSSTAVRLVPFLQQPVIQLRDAVGNAVSQSGVAVTVVLASGPGSAVLGGTKTVSTNASGTASFTNLSIDRNGTFTLRFSSGTLTTVTSTSIVIP